MKRFYSVFILTSMLFLLSSSGVKGDIRKPTVSDRLYKKAKFGLQSGNPEQMLKAIWMLGGLRRPASISLLGHELLRHLKASSPYLKSTSADPYLKSEIVKVLAKIGHQNALPFYLEALANTREIIAKEKLRVMEQRKDARKFVADLKATDAKDKGKDSELRKTLINSKVMGNIVPERRGPGPMVFGKGHAIPYSPDVFWSPSDERKTYLSNNKENVTYKFRRLNYNYVNLSIHILHAIGEVYDVAKQKKAPMLKSYTKTVASYLKHEYSAIRSAAAYSLARIGTRQAVVALHQAAEKEKSLHTRINFAFSILYNDRTQTNSLFFLIKELNNADETIRYVAARSLRDLRMGEAITPLITRLRLEQNPLNIKMMKQAVIACRRDNTNTMTD